MSAPARSKAWVCSCWLAGWDWGFEPRRGHGCLSLVIVVCCQGEVFAPGRSLVQRSPTECGVSVYDREASATSRSWLTRTLWTIKKIKFKQMGTTGTTLLSDFFYYYVSISDIMGWFLSATETGADNARTYNNLERRNTGRRLRACT